MPDSAKDADGVSRYSDPITAPGGRVGRGAVLYDTREPHARPCCARPEGRCLAHVAGVYEETSTGSVFFRVWDGTHTTGEWIHGDDLLALFEPAGWSCPPGIKPTYILTREHGVDDHHDLMTDGGVSREDLNECWCCGGLTERPSLCGECELAGCNRFTDECESDHKPVVADGGHYGPPPNTGRVHDPGPAPEDACIECGDYGGVRCGCCGFPLCGRHHEVGGGFCSKFTVIGDVPTCAYDHEVYVRPLPRPDGEEPFVLDDGHGVVFHLHDPDGSGAPFCGGLPASRVTGRPLGDSLIDSHDLCSDCAEAAKYERRARKRLVGRDLRRQRGETA